MKANYKILFVCALQAELKVIKQAILQENIGKNISFSFFESGFGNYETILNLTRYLEKNNPDFIVNIGVCGFVSEKYNVIQIARIKNISNKKELISPIFVNFAPLKSISCSDEIVYEKSILECDFVDMESYGFELVGDEFQIPRMILKVPVDEVGEQTKAFDWQKAKIFLQKNIDYKKLISGIELFLQKTTSKNEIGTEIKQKIFTNFNLTFSEKIILDKLINKIFVLDLFDLEKFFEENKSIDKKVFLKKIKDIVG